MTEEEFVDWALDMCRRPTRLAITGWPAVGKTTLSQRFVARLDGALHIQAESWIYPMEYRESHRFSGSDPRSYDRSKAYKDLTQLLVKGEFVDLGSYEHSAGRITSSKRVRHVANTAYILDGTLFSSSQFARFVDLCVFIAPVDPAKWLDIAVQRDVVERQFERQDALDKNRAKENDMLLLQLVACDAYHVEWSVDAAGTFHYALARTPRKDR